MTNDAFHKEVRIEASPEIVFAHFIDPARFARWMGIDHKLDPVAGGLFQVDINGRDIAVGDFVEVDCPRRVVFTWGWQGSADVPPGSTTIEVDLIPDGEATVVQFTHRGLPSGRRDAHVEGWEHFLPRLATSAAGGDPGPDPWAA